MIPHPSTAPSLMDLPQAAAAWFGIFLPLALITIIAVGFVVLLRAHIQRTRSQAAFRAAILKRYGTRDSKGRWNL